MKTAIGRIVGWVLMLITITTLAACLGMVAATPFDPAQYCDDLWVETVETHEWVRVYEPGCVEGWRLYPNEAVRDTVGISVWLFLTVLGVWWAIKRNLAARA